MTISSKSPSKRRTEGKSSNKTRRVRIHSPANETRIYVPGSEEKKMSPKRVPRNRCGNDVYPCTNRGAVFETEEEWKEYQQLLRERNKTTGYKSARLHKSNMMMEFVRKGILAKKIPPEWRLYNIQTGEIFDLRTTA